MNLVAQFEMAGIPSCFQMNYKNHLAYYHFIKRDIASVVHTLNQGMYFDIITPFDYGGYSFTCKEIIPHFFEAFSEYCKKENIVSEFIRFCPTYDFDFDVINEYIDLYKVNDLIYIDLATDFWNGYSRGRKSNINQIKKKAYSVQCIEMNDFYFLYKETMMRNQAHSYFYFDEISLQKLVDEKFARIFGIYVDKMLVSSMIILDETDISYYFLGATSNSLLSSHANALLFHEVALMLQKEGQKKFFLGGGRVGVYDFKQRFSKKTLPYFIGKKVYNESVYNELVSITKRHDNNFFPRYREKII